MVCQRRSVHFAVILDSGYGIVTKLRLGGNRSMRCVGERFAPVDRAAFTFGYSLAFSRSCSVTNDARSVWDIQCRQSRDADSTADVQRYQLGGDDLRAMTLPRSPGLWSSARGSKSPLMRSNLRRLTLPEASPARHSSYRLRLRWVSASNGRQGASQRTFECSHDAEAHEV